MKAPVNMKKMLVMLFLGLMTPALFGTQIIVSPSGDIATLADARDAVRSLRAAGQQGDIDVLIQNGTYVLDETLIFGLEDSAPKGSVTRYRAAEGARPLISGGRAIKNWKKTDLAEGKIWVAEVPWAKGDAFFHALFDGSQLLQRAQSESITITNESSARQYAGLTQYRLEFGYEGNALKQWDNLEDIELYGSPTRKWMVNYLPIASLDLEAKKGKLAIPATYRMAGPFVVENCIDFLDAPGEWVLNSQEGRLYYWPKSASPGDQIVAPALNELIRVEGVNDPSVAGTKDQPVEGIVFEGLRFAHADRQKWLPEDKGIQHDWNMLVNCQLLTGGAGNTADPSATLARNIFYHTDTKPVQGFHYGLTSMGSGLDYNLYYHEQKNIAEPLLIAQRKASRTKKADLNSLAADPQFKDHAHGDFSFKAGSPALKLGIEALPWETVRTMGTSCDPFLDRFATGVPVKSMHPEPNLDRGRKLLELEL